MTKLSYPLASASWPIDLSEDLLLRKSFDLLRDKWAEVPYTQFDRIKPRDLLNLSDRDILDTWTNAYLTNSVGDAFSVRGWYQILYKGSFRDKNILDIGCGLAQDSIFFSENGATVTFVDIVQTNIDFVKRVCRAKGLKNVTFCYMEDLNSLSALPKDYDIIYCCGSFINAPLELARIEAQALLEHLPVGGRWIELGYPKSRWEREGRMPFDKWGAKTDGGAPWIEWHDLEKLRYMLAPVNFDVILNLEFHNSDFNWFDLIRRPGPMFNSPSTSDGETPIGIREESAMEMPSMNNAAAHLEACSQNRDLWNPGVRARRPAITEGFVMPGFAGHYWIWPEEYALLAKYVDLTKGDYLEIGSMCGIIAMSLAEKYPHRHFVCVDAFEAGHGTIAGEKETFLRNLREHDLKNVTLIEGDSLRVVPGLSEMVDIAFIDANHAYEYVLGDALNCWPLLTPGGFIIFHDYDCVEGTTRAVNEFLKQTGAHLVERVSSVAVVYKSADDISSSTTDGQERHSVTGEKVYTLQDEVERLTQLLSGSEHERAKIADEKNRLEAMWQAVELSAGWRVLNKWRNVRNGLAPENSLRRKLYDSFVRNVTGRR